MTCHKISLWTRDLFKFGEEQAKRGGGHNKCGLNMICHKNWESLDTVFGQDLFKYGEEQAKMGGGT